MAASIVSSAQVIARKVSPAELSVTDVLGRRGDGKARVIRGTVEVATTSIDEIGDTVLLFEVAGNESIVDLYLWNDDLDSNASPTLAVDVGLYKDVSLDGTSATTVDADAFASAITQLQAAVTGNPTNIRFESGVNGVETIEKTVAECGGESKHSDPRYVGLKVTAAAATAAAGTVTWLATVIAP